MDENDASRSDRLADGLRAALGVVGATLVGVGGWMHYPPLGPALAGAMLFAIALIGGLRAR